MNRTERAKIPARERRGMVVDDIELRDDGDAGNTFIGHAAVFDVWYTVYDMWGPYQERIAAGAFTNTLRAKADVRFLVNHEGIPLARTKSGTLLLEEDSIGLRSEAPLDPGNPTVIELKSAMGRRDLDQMSHSFRVVRQEWNGDYTERTILEEELFDVSVVTFPASPTTDAGLRARHLFDALEGIEGNGVEELLVGFRSTRKMPSQEALRNLTTALEQLLEGDPSSTPEPALEALAATVPPLSLLQRQLAERDRFRN